MAQEKVSQNDNKKVKGKSANSFRKYFRETVLELKKVVWPTRKQLVINTAVVVVASLLMAAFITGFDTIFHKIEALVIK